MNLFKRKRKGRDQIYAICKIYTRETFIDITAREMK